jgi:hypothetical protein
MSLMVASLGLEDLARSENTPDGVCKPIVCEALMLGLGIATTCEATPACRPALDSKKRKQVDGEYLG